MSSLDHYFGEAVQVASQQQAVSRDLVPRSRLSNPNVLGATINQIYAPPPVARQNETLSLLKSRAKELREIAASHSVGSEWKAMKHNFAAHEIEKLIEAIAEL